jgi:hypothetical protein
MPAELLAAEPGARLHFVERQTHGAVWLAVVTREPIAHLVAELGEDVQIAQRPGTVAGADEKHAGRADDEERDPAAVEEHAALHEPPGGKRGELAGDTVLSRSQPPAIVEDASERSERVGL